MSKKKRNKQLGQQSLPPPGAGPHSKEEIFEWFATHKIHAVVRFEDGKDTLFVGSFDAVKPLPRGFYLVAQRYHDELLDLVKRSDVKVCIDPSSSTHRDSIREDEQGRHYCHACATYRDVSEKMRTGHAVEAEVEVKPYLYVLPEDLKTVQLLATIAAMDAAFIVLTTGQKLNATMGIPALAVNLALGHERIQVDGKEGTNDAITFREVFVSVVPRIFPAMLAVLEETPKAMHALETCDAQERWQKLTIYASSQPDLLNAIDDGPISLGQVEKLL